MSFTYTPTPEYTKQVSRGKENYPAGVPLIREATTLHASADRYFHGDPDFHVTLALNSGVGFGDRNCHLTIDATHALIAQLNNAVRIAQENANAKNRHEEAARIAAERAAAAASAKPHPTAQRDPVRVDCWIWCIDGQRFGFQYASGYRNRGSFKPGVNFTSGRVFDDDLHVHVSDIGFVTPERIALWTKLAYNAGYTLNGGF